MVRILVHGLAGTQKGGIETFVLNMKSMMSDSIMFDYVIEESSSSEITIETNGDILLISPKKKVLKNILNWLQLLKQRKDIDSAVYFNWYSMAWFFPVIIARIFGYRVIIHAHNNDLHDCGKLQRLLHNINKRMQRCFHIVRLTNSQLSQEFFFGDRPATLVYNAIDTSRFRFNAEARIRIREKLGIENKNVYGFSGRLSYQKNPIFLMEVFSEIEKLDQNAVFLVCGDGDLKQEMMAKAETLKIPVFFTGAVKSIENYYSAMDCFILPSRFEGLGIVLIEAQCNGLPCMTSADVVPQEAKVTDILSYVSLSEPASKWAEIGVDKINKVLADNRNQYAGIVSRSRFNIYGEAKKLEEVLKNEMPV